MLMKLSSFRRLLFLDGSHVLSLLHLCFFTASLPIDALRKTLVFLRYVQVSSSQEWTWTRAILSAAFSGVTNLLIVQFHAMYFICLTHLHPPPSVPSRYVPNAGHFGNLHLWLSGAVEPLKLRLCCSQQRHFPQTSASTHRCHLIALNTPRLSTFGKDFQDAGKKL